MRWRRIKGTSQKRPRYSCPDLKDDAMEELTDRCDVITLASMAGSFKSTLDSTNNIIAKNPRVQERFDVPDLLGNIVFKKNPTIMQDLSTRCIATRGESVSTYPR